MSRFSAESMHLYKETLARGLSGFSVIQDASKALQINFAQGDVEVVFSMEEHPPSTVDLVFIRKSNEENDDISIYDLFELSGKEHPSSGFGSQDPLVVLGILENFLGFVSAEYEGLLQGDASYWQEIMVRKTRLCEEHTNQGILNALAVQGEAAWNDKNYEKFIKVYSQFEGVLPRSIQLKLSRAKKMDSKPQSNQA